jgi:hypothetical protein
VELSGRDGVAACLERYAIHWDLPVRMSTRVDRLTTRSGGGYVAFIGHDTITCDNVVVATGTYGRTPNVPDFERELDVGILQPHSSEDLAARRVQRNTARVTGVTDGLPVLADGTVLGVRNVIWCTGFKQVFDWIEVPIFGDDGWPREYRGVGDEAPGLFFCGLSFRYAFRSMVFPGVGRDAEYVARQIASRMAHGQLSGKGFHHEHQQDPGGDRGHCPSAARRGVTVAPAVSGPTA